MHEAVDVPRPPAPISWLERVDAIANAVGTTRTRLLVVLAAAVAALCGAIAVGAVRVLATSEQQAAPELSLPRATRGPGAAPTTSGGPIVVAAAGAVAHPGVYKMNAGARVVDVVQAAGGTTSDADLDRVNLAAKVADGERVYVPRRGEPGDPGAVGPAAGVGGGADAAAIVDLNTATAAELEALPGVGPATAEAIIDYRTQHGRFRSIEELLEVRGIGEAKLAQIRPHVRVS